LLDELAKGELEVKLVEQLFTKIRNDFGETSEEERKIEQLRTIEQGGRTCDEYVQEFKKITRGSMLSLSLDDSRTTQCKCLGRTQWSSLLDWTTYLYYFYKWLYPTSLRSYVLLECSTIT